MMTFPKSRNIALAVTVGAGLLVLAGCKSTGVKLAVPPPPGQNQMAAKSINDRCPIPAFRAVDPRIPSAVYKGHLIAFCSPQCRKRWQHWTVAQKDAFVSKQFASSAK